MGNKNDEKRGVTVKDAIALLEKNNVKIDEKNAEKVLHLMYFLAKLIVNQNFKK